MQPHFHRDFPRRIIPFIVMAGVLAGVWPGRAVEFDIRRDATVAAIESVKPSVVNIATSRVVEYGDFYDPLLHKYYGETRQNEELNSIGSGVIISDDGYILTNVHVLRRAYRAQVKLWDGRVYDAEPQVLINPRSDVAVLKLRCKPGEKFQAVPFAKDDDLLLGETVLALGDPFGLGDSVSRGILSSKDRRPPIAGEPLNVQNWLQTDAAINPGNSGGPLIDLRAELIGLNVATAGQGVGFAIPVKQVSESLSKLFTPEVTGSLWFGAQIKAGTSPLTVSQVQPGSPADQAGLRVGQQVLQVNGHAPSGFIEFSQLIAGAEAHTVSLRLQQNGQPFDASVILVPFDRMIRAKTGLTLRAATNNADGQDSFAGRGMVIDRVEPGSPAARAQLQPGFVLSGIDGTDVDKLLAVGDSLSARKAGDTVSLKVIVPRRMSDNFVAFQQGTVNLLVR